MFRTLLCFLFLNNVFSARAQALKVMPPVQPVVAGTAFQIQYIVSRPEDLAEFTPPSFENFRLVSGPNKYRGQTKNGDRSEAIENITFTLVAARAGHFELGSATAKWKDGTVASSTPAALQVVVPPAASYRSHSSYTDVSLYAPVNTFNEERVIVPNLFLEAKASRLRVYPGEAAVISFTLYSRLQSTSEVLNAPGLYGLSVSDMINTDESHPGIDTINGKIFNTALLRKIQVYATVPGKIVVDAMQVHNSIEFKAGPALNVIEKNISSPSITLTAIPFPPGAPASFAGAVGRFAISVKLDTNALHAGQASTFHVIVTGAGNFIQLTPPEIRWPASLNALEPTVTSQLDRSVAPLNGSMRFDFPFTADKEGDVVIPAISFSFFDPVARRYIELKTQEAALKVLPAKTTASTAASNNTSKARPPRWPYYFLFILLIPLVFFLWNKLQIKRDVKKDKPLAAELDQLASAGTDKEAGERIIDLVQEKIRGRYLTAVQLKEWNVLRGLVANASPFDRTELPAQLARRARMLCRDLDIE